MDPSLALQLVRPCLAAAVGAALVLFARLYRVHARRRNAARLRQLEAGGEEAYFEERRALQAYRPAKSDALWRLLGAVLVLMAGFQIYRLLAG